jgi:hypothetical protein
MKSIAAVFGVAPMVAACAMAVAPPPAPEPPQDRLVGTMRWANPRHKVWLCDAPIVYGQRSPHCQTLKAGSAVTIQRAVFTYNMDVPIPNGYAVTDSTGAMGFISEGETLVMDSEVARKQYAEVKGSCNRKGGVQIGMSREQIYASCWGHPKSVNETITARGKHEQFVYRGGYLYLDDGVLTSIQTNR